MPLSLRVTDISDRDIMRVVHEVADGDGWADLTDITERFLPGAMRGTKERRKSAIRCAATRLAYMRRVLGVVTKREQFDKTVTPHIKYTQWRLTSKGETFLQGKLTAAQENQLSGYDDARLIAAMENIANQYTILSPSAAVIMRRQWQYGYGQRRR